MGQSVADARCSRSELRSYDKSFFFKSIPIRLLYPDRSDLFSFDYQALVPVMNFWKEKFTPADIFLWKGNKDSHRLNRALINSCLFANREDELAVLTRQRDSRIAKMGAL